MFPPGNKLPLSLDYFLHWFLFFPYKDTTRAPSNWTYLLLYDTDSST